MPTAAGFVCWKCGADLASLPLPLSRTAECPKCRAYLHSCRMCRDYNPQVAEQCDEDRAEEVRDKETANFCDWFKPRADAHRPRDPTRAQASREKLESLFGGSGDADQAPSARDQLRDLFGTDKKSGK